MEDEKKEYDKSDIHSYFLLIIPMIVALQVTYVDYAGESILDFMWTYICAFIVIVLIFAALYYFLFVIIGAGLKTFGQKIFLIIVFSVALLVALLLGFSAIERPYHSLAYRSGYEKGMEDSGAEEE